MSTKLDSKLALHVPQLEELARTIQDGLALNFETCRVTVVDCPNLTENPFCLAAKGLGGSPRIADVGGPGYLFPDVRKDKLYDLRQVCNTCQLHNAFVLGPGGGPLHLIGCNSEMVHNAHFVDEKQSIFKSYVIFLKESPERPYTVKLLSNKDANEFALMSNLILTEGKTDKVLKIEAKKRIGKENFVSCMRLAIAKKYGTTPVGLGGVFIIKSGKAKLHIMPDLPDKFSSEDEITSNWLKYFEMDSPLVCTGVFVSHDPGLDLRQEHTHCFSSDGKNGGHYHYDTTADEVEYEGYFTPAELLYRIDRP